MSARKSSVRRPAAPHAAHAAGRAAATAAIESLEGRRLLSAAGDYDPTFGTGGRSAVDVDLSGGVAGLDTRHGTTVSVGADTAGHTVLVRVNDAGALDSTFNGTGRATLAAFKSPTDVFIQPDDKVIFTAARPDDGKPVLARLNKNGALDTSFGGGDGVVDFNGLTTATAVEMDASNRIVVGGDFQGRFAAARVTPAGVLDASFSGDGQYATDSTGQAADIKTQADGKVILVGTFDTQNQSAGSDVTWAEAIRLTAAGLPDTTFAGNGFAVYKGPAAGSAVEAGAVDVAPDGKIVVGATVDGLLRPVRFNTNGTLDRVFAADNGAGQAARVNDIVASYDNQKVVVWYAFLGSGTLEGAVSRYNVDGSTDLTFNPGGYDGRGGTKVFPEAFGLNGIYGDLQADMRIVAGGAADVEVDPLTFKPVALFDRLLYTGAGTDPIGANRVLHVTGTNLGDSITVGGVGPLVLVQVGNAKSYYDPDRFGSVQVDGLGGNDVIEMTDAPVVAVINGGDGKDFILGPAGLATINGGAGDDYISAGSAPSTIDGGDGNDTLVGSPADDTIRGGTGDDFLYGEAGNDVLQGQDGNDALDGGAGADDLGGGAGGDTVDYSTRTANLTVSLGTTNDDGEAGEHDNVRGDVENVFGGAGNDVLRGNASANYFRGNGGDDQLYGGSGNDVLDGGTGRDQLYGEDGDDKLYARDGFVDFLSGGGGTDAAQKDAGDATNGVEKLI